MSEEKNNRTKRFYFRTTEEEAVYIMGKFKTSGMKRLSDYLRKMSMLGFVLTFDTSEFLQMQKNISTVASNVNQIARRINSTSNIYSEDMKEIQKGVERIWQSQEYIQSRLRKLNL